MSKDLFINTSKTPHTWATPSSPLSRSIMPPPLGVPSLLMSHDHLHGYHDPIKRHKWPQNGSLMFLQPMKGFSIVHKGFSIITKAFIIIGRVFSAISRVFNIFSKVVASRSSLVGTWTLSTGYKELQGTNPLCKGSKALQGGTWWLQWHPVRPLQVHVGINDNFINNLPLCHWWQQLMLPLWACSPFCLHLSLCLHLSPFGINGKGCPHICAWNLWSLLTAPPVNMHDPWTCLYAWSNHPFSFEFILQPHELKVC